MFNSHGCVLLSYEHSPGSVRISKELALLFSSEAAPLLSHIGDFFLKSIPCYSAQNFINSDAKESLKAIA